MSELVIRKGVPLPKINFQPGRKSRWVKLHEMDVGDMIFVAPNPEDKNWERKPYTAVRNNNRRELKKAKVTERKSWTARKWQDPDTKVNGIGIWRKK